MKGFDCAAVAFCREMGANIYKHGKVILRPKYVMETYVHHAVLHAKGWEQKQKVDTNLAVLKHITWLELKDVRCADLVHEDTDAHPS